MSQIYELNTTGAPGTSALKVFDGAGSVVFDSKFRSLKKWMDGGVIVAPRYNVVNAPEPSHVGDVAHAHPSGKSCLIVAKCWGRSEYPGGGTVGWRGMFVRVHYASQSHTGDFVTVANSFLRFGNMHYDQSPYYNNTAYYYFTMFDVPAVP